MRRSNHLGKGLLFIGLFAFLGFILFAMSNSSSEDSADESEVAGSLANEGEQTLANEPQEISSEPDAMAVEDSAPPAADQEADRLEAEADRLAEEAEVEAAIAAQSDPPEVELTPDEVNSL